MAFPGAYKATDPGITVDAYKGRFMRMQSLGILCTDVIQLKRMSFLDLRSSRVEIRIMMRSSKGSALGLEICNFDRRREKCIICCNSSHSLSRGNSI